MRDILVPPSERDPLLDSGAHTDPPMLPVG